MGKVTLICVFLVLALLLEDGSSVRKKTSEEEEEDERIAEKVNATLEAEEKKRKEEDEKTREKKNGKEEGEGEASPNSNFTCPEVKPCPVCPKVKKCLEPAICPKCPEKTECPPVECGPCPEVKPCKPCRECGQCPEERPCKKEDCPEVKPCDPCGPCPGVNATVDRPPTVTCPEVASMSTAVAMSIGAVASLVVTGVAATLGLLLRYASPIESGFVFLAAIILVWYLCSHYPEAARELGGRVVEILREATTTLSHRVVEALRHHNNQVGYPIFLLILFGVPCFHLKVSTKIFYVEKIKFLVYSEGHARFEIHAEKFRMQHFS
jgi:hypothetical protein